MAIAAATLASTVHICDTSVHVVTVFFVVVVVGRDYLLSSRLLSSFISTIVLFYVLLIYYYHLKVKLENSSSRTFKDCLGKLFKF